MNAGTDGPAPTAASGRLRDVIPSIALRYDRRISGEVNF